ncbi:ATP-binding protein [Myxococcota bacterium]|nr:ATP-binding protein [Myxococcota bacterium]
MTDPRIQQLLDAARRMREGDFQFDLAVRGGDDLDQLALELLQLSHTLDQRFTELRAVAQVAERVNAGLVLEEVCSQVYDTFRGLIPYDRIGLALLEDGGRMLRARWARTSAAQVHLPVGFAAPMAGSSLQQVLDTGAPRILNDLPAYLAAHPTSESTRLVVREGVQSSLTCPLVAEGKPVGFLFFSSNHRDAYQDAHVHLYQAIAAQLSVIVEKSRLYQELIELDRFRSRMLGVAAHDLRNPLTLVLHSLELIELGMGGPLSDHGQRLVAGASRAAARMVTLIEDLLDVSAIEAGRLVLQRAEVDVVPWLGGIAADQRLLAERKGIHLRTDLPAQPLLGHFDKNRLEQVVVNLVGNAIKFSPAGTTVTLRATRTADRLRIQVQDEGPGIPTSDLPRLFVPFARASNRPTGGEPSTGLGLAISKRIVEVHQGSLEVESQVGQGSTFTIDLPA